MTVVVIIWFNIQLCDIFLCSWMISWTLVDHTNIGRDIGCILDTVYAPSVSMRDSIRSETSFFHTSMVVQPGLDDHLCIHRFIHKGFDGVDVTVGLSSWRHRRNTFHIYVSRDDCRVPLLRDESRDDRRSSSCRDASRDDCRN